MNNYDKNNLVKIARRENNKKRSYVLVNPLQGKHIPVEPSRAMNLFEQLAEKLQTDYPDEKLLIIGFAETATAIGAALAQICPQAVFYMHTTREYEKKVKNYLYFSEDHSHASEQKLATDQFRQWIQKTDRIIFAEDEVTTGNTILHIIKEIKEYFGAKIPLKFGIVSILNSMQEKVLEDFKKNKISCTFLSKIESIDYSSVLEHYKYPEDCKRGISCDHGFNSGISVDGKKDPRIGVIPKDYKKSCDELVNDCIKNIGEEKLEGKSVLVLGSEEFMFPPLYLAQELEKKFSCKNVRFHATTRSPILPSTEDEYPLHVRYELQSVYDKDRTIFVYNLKEYDIVIYLHDAVTEVPEGIRTLRGALKQAGCKDIYVFQWR